MPLEVRSNAAAWSDLQQSQPTVAKTADSIDFKSLLAGLKSRVRAIGPTTVVVVPSLPLSSLRNFNFQLEDTSSS